MSRITKLIGKLVVVLCAALMLCGCGAPTEDPVAEDYLAKMLDAIEKQDADTAYSLWWDEKVSFDDLKPTMEGWHEYWDGGEYTYKLISSSVTDSVTTDGAYTITNCNYEVTTKDNSYVFEVTYVKDKGLVGFYLHKR